MLFEFKRLEKDPAEALSMIPSTSLSSVPFFFFSCFYGFFQLLTGSLNHQATSSIGQTVPESFHRSPIEAFTVALPLWQGLRLFQMRYHFQNSEEKNVAQTLTIMSLILGFLLQALPFLNYWMGITPQNGEPSSLANGQGHSWWFILWSC